ncbi:MAG: transketolase [Anaerolineae bacterium]|jgi:transketolase
MPLVSIEHIDSLEKRAASIRADLIRTFYQGGGGHFGGCLSAIDILTALYFHAMQYDAADPKDPDRDRFVLSKGHASVAHDCTLCAAGFFPREWLETYATLDAPISTHPDMHRTPGVEMSTGSLGHGISVALGMAIAAKRDQKEHRIYCLIGDGESHEGSVWEAAMAAAHHGLDNLIVITDRNQLSMDGPTCEVMTLEPLAEKWRAFGWGVREIDGHQMGEIVAALDDVPFEGGRPSQIIARTVKAKGLELAEGVTAWHYGSLSTEDMEAAIAALTGGTS